MLHRCVQNVVAKAPAAFRKPPAEPIQPGHAKPAGLARDSEVGLTGGLRGKQVAW